MISRTLTGEYNFWRVEEVRGKGVEWLGGGWGESDITSINFEGNSIKASVNFNFGF